MPAFPAAALRHRRGSARCAPSEGALAPALAELPRRNLRAEAHWLVLEGLRRLTFFCFVPRSGFKRSLARRSGGAPRERCTIFFTKRLSTSSTCWKPFPIAGRQREAN